MTPSEVRRQLEEAHAALQSSTKSPQDAAIDHAVAIAKLRQACPHENTEAETSQVGAATFCADCGALVALVGEYF